MNFDRFILTDLGIAARQQAIAGNKTITFTRGRVGTGKPMDDSEIPAMTDLIAGVWDIVVTESSARSNTHDISLVLDNSVQGGPFDSPFTFSELGIYAQVEGENEILYAYSYSSSNITIPARTTPYITQYRTTTTILRDENVTVVVDDSLAYATQSDLDDVIAEVELKANKVLNAVANDIPILTADGNLADSGKKFTTDMDVPSDDDIPTSSAVNSAINKAKAGLGKYQGLFGYYGTKAQIESQSPTDSAMFTGIFLQNGQVYKDTYNGTSWNGGIVVEGGQNSGDYASIHALLDYPIQGGYQSGIITLKNDGVNPISFDIDVDQEHIVPIATTAEAGIVRAGGDISVDSAGNVTVPTKLDKTGGILTGDLHIGDPNIAQAIPMIIFGDGDYVHLKEYADDQLEIKASTLKLASDNILNNQNSSFIVDNLTTQTTNQALSAKQGYQLNQTKAPTSHTSSTDTYGKTADGIYGHAKFPSTSTSATDDFALPYHTIYNTSLAVNLNDYRTAGIWNFYYPSSSSTNFPSDYGSLGSSGYNCILEVIPFYSNTAVSQILRKRATNNIWIRYSTSASAWSAWEKVNATAYTLPQGTTSVLGGFKQTADTGYDYTSDQAATVNPQFLTRSDGTQYLDIYANPLPGDYTNYALQLNGNNNNFPTFSQRGKTGTKFIRSKIDAGGRAGWLRNKSYGSGWLNPSWALPFSVSGLQTSSRPSSSDHIVPMVNPGCIINTYDVHGTFTGSVSGSGHYWAFNIPIDESNDFFADMLGGYDLMIQLCFCGGSVTTSSVAFTDSNYNLWLAPYNSSYSSSYVHHFLPMTDTRFGTLSNSNRTWTPVANQYVDSSNFDAGIVSVFRFRAYENKRYFASPDGSTINLSTGFDVGLGSTASLGTVTYNDLDVFVRMLLVS